jgi:iron complex transport system ATP-binding protein
MIQLKSLEIGYRHTLVHIHELYLDQGITALIGKNGSGKSTLLKTLCGTLRARSGTIFFNNVETTTLSSEDKSKFFAFVGSTYPPVPFMSVEEFVLLGRTPYIGSIGIFSEKDRQIASHYIELFGLKELSHRELIELSDGEKQLAAFARAFTQETPFIAMDEPTAFLDYGNRRRLLNLLQKVALEQGRCVLFSTHDVDLCLEEKIALIGIDQKRQLIQPSLPIAKERILSDFFGAQ